MVNETVRLELSAGLARVTLDRPPLNILDIAMLDDLGQVLESLDDDPRVTAVLLTGEGKAFCAGVSVEDHTADKVDAMIGSFHAVIDRLLGLACPVVAALNGAALGGGCELALACDAVLATESARIGQPEIKLGVFPPAAAVLLPRLVGRQRAMDLVLSGRTMDAAEAARMGLVTWAIPDDGFDSAVEEYAAGIASLSRPVLRLAKRAVHEGGIGDTEAAMRRVERLYLEDLMGLQDAHEGLLAFREKRAPVWQEAGS
ncbi:MAG: enoyl-CoA hydratase-related protein [Gemmatimonadota bacterium]|nr:enoyl-CoA hydratase-related protein [Gemmatimonadota bacterium]